MTTPTYDLIETTTLASAASSVTFTSITQDYRDLVLVVNNIGTASSGQAIVRFNSDSGSNYPFVFMRGNGSDAESFDGTGDSFIGPVQKIEDEGGSGNSGIFQIMDYSATDKHTSVLSRINNFDNVRAFANRYASTSAITNIEVLVNFGSDFAAGSTFSLYGIAA